LIVGGDSCVADQRRHATSVSETVSSALVTR
jgi:hypothetical protein